MKLKKIMLAPNCTLNIIDETKFKTNYISFDFLVPLKRDTAPLNALTVQVLSRGSKKYPNITALSRAQDELYSTSVGCRAYKIGEVQAFGFFSYPLANEYALDGTDILSGALDMMGEIMFNPVTENGSLLPAYVESEKRVLADAIRAKINNKNRYAVDRCCEEMCRGEAFSVPETGYAEDVEAITPEALTEHYRHIYDNVRAEIYFIGRCDEEALKAKLTSMLSGVLSDKTPDLNTEIIRRADSVREVVEEQPVEQGKLSIGYRTGVCINDSDYMAFMMFREVLGGSPASKLFMNVREKLSLCYYCQAIPNMQKGIMIITSGIEVKNKQKTQDEIKAQIEACRKGEFTEEELESAKKSMINGYNEILDDAGAIKMWYLGRSLAGRSDSPLDAVELVKAIGAADITKAAAKLTEDTVYFLKGTLNEGGSENE